MKIVSIDPRKITVRERFNTRAEFGDMAEFKDQILAEGVKVPMPAIIDEKAGTALLGSQGHRRLRAVLELIEKGNEKTNNGKSLLDFPLYAEEDGLSDSERNLELITLNNGKPLTMLEESEVISREFFGIDDAKEIVIKRKEVAARVGKTLNAIYNLEELWAQTELTKRYVRRNKIAASLVIELVYEVKAGKKNPIMEEVRLKVEEKVTKAVLKAEEANGEGAKVKSREVKEVVEKKKEESDAEVAAKIRREEEKQELKEGRKLIARVEKLQAASESLQGETDIDKQSIAILQSIIGHIKGGNITYKDILNEVNLLGKMAKDEVKLAVKQAKDGAKA